MIEQATLLATPFPGLRPFETHENELFFGRDGQSDEVLTKLRAARFVAVVGTSGSGKSSLVRAGLLPALLSGHMTSAGSSWRIAIFRPGSSPLSNLAKALGEPGVFGTKDEEGAGARLLNIERALRRSSLGLLEVVGQARMEPHENLLILADQFEELFRFRKKSSDAHPEDEAAAFVKLLLEAKQPNKPPGERLPIYVILTMRSDYLGDCASFWGLPEAINEGQYLIPRMTDDDRREAITGPVITGGGEITAPLVNRLLNDAGDDPAQLPILQHALMRTWDYWKTHGKASGPIDLPHYEQIGGMEQALSIHADEAFGELSPELQKVAEKLFKCLTEKEADNREGRRPATIGEISAVTEADEGQVKIVVESFRREGRSFLMPPPGVPLTTDTLIDISHESLIRGWQRLRKWVDEEAQAARQYKRLADTAALFPEQESFLRDPALQIGLNWLEDNKPTKAWAERYHPGFDKTVEYLEASRDNRKVELDEKERRQKEKIENAQALAAAEKRRVKLRNWMLLGLLLLMLMFAGSTALAVQQWLTVKDTLKQVEAQKQIAEQERDRADRENAAAQTARQEAEEQRGNAVLAQESAERDRDKALKAENERATQLAVAERERAEAKRQRDAAQQATIEADRQKDIAKGALSDAQKQRDLAVQAQADAEAQRANAVEAKEEAERQKIEAEQQRNEANSLLATVKEIDSSAPYFKAVMRGHKWPVRSAALSPDGEVVVTASETGESAKFWDVRTGNELFSRSLYTAAFSHDGKLIAGPDVRGDIIIEELGSLSAPRVIKTNGELRFSIAFSPDDRRIALYNEFFKPGDGVSPAIAQTGAGSQEVIELWDISAGRRRNKPVVLAGHTGRINSYEFSPDSKYVVTAGADGTARVWDAATGQPVGEPRRHLSGVYRASFSHDGKLFVTASLDGKGRIWDALTGAMLKELPGHEGVVNSAAFSPDGRFIVTTSKSRVYLWEAKAPGTWAELTDNSPTIIKEHEDEVTNAVFSPDGRQFATISQDRTARLWRTATLKPDQDSSALRIAVFRGHIKPVTSVAFSRDSKSLLTASEDKTARVWDLNGLGVFRVARAELKAEPSQYSGRCPATIKFNGTITAEGGSGKVRYKFVYQDGKESLPQELTFDAPGTKEVSVSRDVFRQYSDPGLSNITNGSATIRILEPAPADSNRAEFVVTCTDAPPPRTSGELTPERLKQIMPGATDERIALYLPHLLKAMEEFGINTPLRQAAFLAQVGYNTGDLRIMEEPGTKEDLEKKYGNRKDLGNFEPGDGEKFKGRGAFQITGRYNYQSLGQLLGVDLVAQPERASAPDVAFRTAALYWQRNGLNELADKDDLVGITRRVYGSPRLDAWLQGYYDRAKEALGVATN